MSQIIIEPTLLTKQKIRNVAVLLVGFDFHNGVFTLQVESSDYWKKCFFNLRDYGDEWMGLSWYNFVFIQSELVQWINLYEFFFYYFPKRLYVISEGVQGKNGAW